MNESDRLAAYTLARQQMTEAILLRLVVMLPETERKVLKELSRRHVEKHEAESLFRPASDEEIAICSLGREHAFAAVFGSSS